MIRAALMICLTLTSAPVVRYQTIPEMIESAYAALDSLRDALPEDVAEQVDREAEDETKALEELYFAGYDEDGRAVYGRELSLAKAALLTKKYRAAASGEPPRAYTRG